MVKIHDALGATTETLLMLKKLASDSQDMTVFE